MKEKKHLLIFLVLISFSILTSCRPLGEFISVDYLDDPFPESDIVFQLGVGIEGNTDKIGFVNAEGSQLKYLYLQEGNNIHQPVWSDDGGIIFYGSSGYVVPALIEKDYPFPVILRNLSAYQPSIIHGTNELLLIAGNIVRIDYTTGEILDTYYTSDNDTYGDVDYLPIDIGTNNFVDQNLLFKRRFDNDEDQQTEQLVILDVNTHQEKIILSYSDTPQEITHIINPAFSPNAEWIAYSSNDGIYLIRPNGSENHVVVALSNVVGHTWEPTVSWSPDGKSFVYHHCITSIRWDCQDNDKKENNIIYRYDLETKEETVLVEGGVNPYWRWADPE